MKKLAILLCAYLFTQPLFSQLKRDFTVQPYQAGEQIQNYSFSDFMNADHKNRRISDYEGKYLILDFWSQYCTPCIAGFPKMDSLAHKYSKDLAILLVGVAKTPESLQASKALYQRQVDKYKLKVPAVFDTLMHHDFDFAGVGYVTILDRKGKIISMPLAHLISDSIIQRLVNDLPINMSDRITSTERQQKSDALHKGAYRLQEDFERIRYRSVLTDAQPEFPMDNANFRVRAGIYGLRMFNISGLDMYKRVYSSSDTYFRGSRLAIEMINPARLIDSLYCYELIITDDRYPQRLSHARKELDKALNLESRIEIRKVPCFVLTVTDTLNVSTKGSKPKDEGIDRGASGLNYINQPLSKIIPYLHNALIDYKPLIDGTGIKGNIDFYLELDNSKPKLQRYREALEAAGFRLEEAERETEILVIRDKPVNKP